MIRFLPFLTLAASLFGAVNPPSEPVSALPAILAELPVDEVWAGHPVGFGLLTERGHQFVAYYDAERRLTVASRRLEDTTWIRSRPEGVFLQNRQRLTTVTAWDSHNYLTLALDRDGHLHLSGNMHNDPLVYFRTTRPFDITSFERLDRMTGNREHEVTYPVFFKDSAGNLLFRYRDGGSGRGGDLYNRYDPDTRSWTNLHSSPLLDGQGKRSGYALDPVLGPDGRFHLVWMWRDNPDCSTNHTLSYARSRDLITWEKCDGTPLPLPLALGNAEVIDPSPIRTGLINMTFNLGFDARNRPVVVYHRYDAAGKSQAYAARPVADASRWEITQISNWDFRWAFSGWSSIAAEVTLGSPTLTSDRKHLQVDFATTHPVGNGRWMLNLDDLRPVATLPSIASPLPPATTPGLEVQTATSRDQGRRWMLRWETLPRNRDQPRKEVPPPSTLRVYEVPDTATDGARRIGS